MYRYSVDNAVTYTPDDLILFRESPFAAWMERLTLENPEHGIPPDVGTSPPGGAADSRDDLVDSLRAEGRDVVLIDAAEEEPRRRAETLEAMRAGTDFIVHGTLALGPLSGTADMLMRTSGYSDLGDFLYIPCGSQPGSALNAAFRLSFMADLLQSLQGQLPPQLLVIRSDAEVLPLQTEDHIHYYRAVKERFIAAMQSFRKHRMPDPAESSHFGRWSECAGEVLKQRAQRAGQQSAAEVGSEPEQEAPGDEEVQAEQEPLVAEMPVAAAASGGSGRATAVASRGAALELRARDAGPGPTLLEQARSLSPDAFKNRAPRGRTPNLAQFPISETRPPARERSAGDEALQNLAFIGSNLPSNAVFRPAGSPPASRGPADESAEPPKRESASDAGRREAMESAPQQRGDHIGAHTAEGPSGDPVRARPAPAPNLREVLLPEPVIEGYEVEVIDFETFQMEPREPQLLPPEKGWGGARRAPSEHVDSDQPARSSVVDLDGAPSPRLSPLEGVDGVEADTGRGGQREAGGASRPFSDSLITNEDYDGN